MLSLATSFGLSEQLGSLKTPPVMAVPDAFTTLGTAVLTGSVLANDITREPVTLRANGQPAGTALTLASGARITVAASGSFTFDPRPAHAGLGAGAVREERIPYTLTSTVSGLVSAAEIVITVTGPVPQANTAPTPTGSIAAQSYPQGTAIPPLSFAAVVSDPGDTLAFALAPGSAPLPAGLALSAAGVLGGTPAAEAAAVTLVVRATDTGGLFVDIPAEVAVTAPVQGAVATATVAADNRTLTLSVAGDRTASVPDIRAVSVSAVSPGFDQAGTAVAVTRAIPVLALQRRPFPNHALPDVTFDGTRTRFTLALGEPVYPGDMVSVGCGAGWLAGQPAGTAEVTNAAAQPHQPPVVQWAIPDAQRAVTTIALELAGLHFHGANGQAFARVVFTATGQTSGVVRSTAATQTSVSTRYASDRFPVQVWAGSIPTADFAQGEVVRVAATVCPWVGPAFETGSLATGIQPLSVVIDKADTMPTYAYVSPTGTTGGVASSDPAVARATPFGTIYHAAAAIQVFNAANKGRANCDAGVVRLEAGTYTNTGMTSVTNNTQPNQWATVNTHLIVEPVAGAAVTLNRNSTATQHDWYSLMLHFRGLTLDGSTLASRQVIRGAGPQATANARLIIEGCTMVGTAANTVAPVSSGGAVAWIGGSIAGYAGSISIPASRLARGIETLGTVEFWGGKAMLGCRLVNIGLRNSTSTGNTATSENIVFMFNRLRGGQDTINLANQNAAINWAVGCNSFGATGGPGYGLSRESVVAQSRNHIWAHNTFSGQRMNAYYADDAAVTFQTKDFIRFVGNVVEEFNCKSDVFSGDGENVQNWWVRYKTGFTDNVFLYGTTSTGPQTGGPAARIGEILGTGEVVLTAQEPGVLDYAEVAPLVGWVAYARALDADADVRLTAASTLPGRLVAARAMLSRDLAGTVLPAAQAAPGCYQRA